MIIVLGGGGFLGQHLRRRLIAAGAAFTIVSPRDLNRRGPAAPHEGFMLAQSFDGPEGDALLRRASALVNLASRSVPGTYAAQPWREMAERVAPVATLFGRCAEANSLLKIVQISSGGTVYGRASEDRVNEAAPCAPISGYGLAHLMIEESLRFTGRTAGNPYCILRVSNPVGRFQSSGNQGIVSIAARAAASRSDFPLFGEGHQMRDFLDADDVAESILAACRDRLHATATWNVGSGVGRSVLDVIRIVEEVGGRPIRLRRLPDRSIDVPRIVLDCGRIHNDLGWRAHRDFESSVRDIFRSLDPEAEA